MTALPLLILGLSLLSALGVVFLFYRKEQTARKFLKTEKELQKMTGLEKDKLMAILGSLNDGVIVFDSTTSVSFINASGKKYLNIPHDQPSFSELVQQFPQPIHLSEKLSEALSYNRIITLSEVAIHERFFRVYITPVYKKEEIPHDGIKSHVIGATLLMQDLTHQQQLDKMKEDFTHMVIHELRAPLTAIKDAAALMDTSDDSLDEASRKQLLKLVHDQSKVLLDQVSTILDAGKIEHGKFTIQKVPSDIGKIISGEVSFFLPEAQKKQITLVAEIGNDLPMIPVDAVRITQVITNLISNSLKYTDQGGMIKITVDMKNEQSDPNQNAVCISVSDNGIGIPEDKQKILFTKYSEIGNDTSGKNTRQSTGLGLYITKGIIDAHGGTISIQSAQGKGTTFTITLPTTGETNDTLIASVRPQQGSQLPNVSN